MTTVARSVRGTVIPPAGRKPCLVCNAVIRAALDCHETKRNASRGTLMCAVGRLGKLHELGNLVFDLFVTQTGVSGFDASNVMLQEINGQTKNSNNKKKRNQTDKRTKKTTRGWSLTSMSSRESCCPIQRNTFFLLLSCSSPASNSSSRM